MNICKAFTMESPREALSHINENCDLVEDYGDTAYGHDLYAWDAGGRTLKYCRECKAYIFIQGSEDRGSEARCYTDVYAVKSPKEADKLNKKYSGWDLDYNYKSKYPVLSYRSGNGPAHGWHWRNRKKK